MVEALNLEPSRLPTFGLEAPVVSPETPAFACREQEIDTVRSRLASLGDYSSLILLNPNASDLLPLRRWPGERYVLLARELVKRDSKTAIVFTGAPAEAEQVTALANRVESARCLSLAGKTTLRELLVLFK